VQNFTSESTQLLNAYI